jgi:hypothetical protein
MAPGQIATTTVHTLIGYPLVSAIAFNYSRRLDTCPIRASFAFPDRDGEWQECGP